MGTLPPELLWKKHRHLPRSWKRPLGRPRLCTREPLERRGPICSCALGKSLPTQTDGYIPAGPGRGGGRKGGILFPNSQHLVFPTWAGLAFTRLRLLKEPDFGRLSCPFGNVYRMQSKDAEKVLFFLLPGLVFPQASMWLPGVTILPRTASSHHPSSFLFSFPSSTHYHLEDETLSELTFGKYFWLYKQIMPWQ